MAERPRRIRLLLSPSHPLDAEILAWLDALPRTARGTELKPYFTAALIEYLRKRPSRVSAPDATPREAAPRVASRVSRERGADTRALGRELLEGFGPPRK